METLQLQVGALKNLPVLPQASLQILQAINTPDISIDRLVAALSTSPSLVARLLGLANSAYFSRGKTTTDIRSAVFQVLGLDLVKGLALGVIFNVQFDTGKCQTFESDYFWMRSLVTAVAAQKLASEIGALQHLAPSTVYTSGLLLDIGILALGFLAPDQLNQIFIAAERGPERVTDLVSDQFGLSHFQIGGALLKKWHLPELYQLVLSEYQRHEYVGQEQSLLDLLRLCRRLSAEFASGVEFEPAAYLQNCQALRLPIETLNAIAEQLLESRVAMQQLAYVMGN
ncbi:hypothetical protein BJL95_23100 [Methylomonas sp. LWB]|uniref:HDOD domain-containing protein n=1 Tax=Methylomonas sp. LWB TaxID=1905845 RepID=UPI0008DA6B83|nr:HDOD domain-containing protein [Methylomonas sp. LWB]OHX38101.1 hypothetical protein BJL95_23100 [Methylomonas sp. LWB]